MFDRVLNTPLTSHEVLLKSDLVCDYLITRILSGTSFIVKKIYENITKGNA